MTDDANASVGETEGGFRAIPRWSAAGVWRFAIGHHDFPRWGESLRSFCAASLMLVVGSGLTGCDGQIGEYAPVSVVARGGFVTDPRALGEVRGAELRVWGYVDHGNLYGDAGAKRILGEWWSGEGPDPHSWRFGLKARPGDPVGHSLAVLVPNDARRDVLLERLVSDARAHRATKVFVTGRWFRFHAPMQVVGRTGLWLEVGSSENIRLDRPDGN